MKKNKININQQLTDELEQNAELLNGTEAIAAAIRDKTTGQCGDYYWCIKTELSDNGEIYAYADEIEVKEGALILLSCYDETHKRHPNLVIPAGQWSCIFAASHLDGGAVAVEHWKGEVNPRR